MDGYARSESTKEKITHHNKGHQLEHDRQAAHAAWDAWKSDDPAAWDWALDQREKILKKDPRAWTKAMSEVDAEEAHKKAQEKREREAQQQREAELRAEMDDEMRRQAAVDKLRDEYLQVQATGVKAADNLHPGYAPQSAFAPEPPNAPAYDAANRNRGDFHGLDLGIVKLGVRDGSLETGVNVGIASTEVTLGKNTGVNAEFMPYGGPMHARANAGIGFAESGIHSQVGAGANFFNVVNGDADFGASLGASTGVSGDVRGRVWPVNVQADAGAGIGSDGFHAYTGANTGIADAFGVRTGARFNLDDNSSTAAGVGLNLGGQTLDFGPSIDTYGNRTVRPNLNLKPGYSDEATFYPTGNRDIDP